MPRQPYSVAVLESKFLTVAKYDYNPDIMHEAMTVDAIYMIPGKGTEVAVEPGAPAPLGTIFT